VKPISTIADGELPAHHSRMLEDPNYMWGCKYVYQDNVTSLVTVLISQSYVTNLTKVTTQMPTCKIKRF
jgi:hypothetical protein